MQSILDAANNVTDYRTLIEQTTYVMGQSRHEHLGKESILRTCSWQCANGHQGGGLIVLTDIPYSAFHGSLLQQIITILDSARLRDESTFIHVHLYQYLLSSYPNQIKSNQIYLLDKHTV